MNLTLYDPNNWDHQVLLHAWWEQLADDRVKLFHRLMKTFTAALARAIVVFGERAGEVVLVAWLEPWFDGAWLGLWVAKNCRHSKDTLNTVLKLLDTTVHWFPVVVICPWQEKVLREYQAVGFQVLGTIPRVNANLPVTMMYLTRQTFEDSYAKRRFHQH